MVLCVDEESQIQAFNRTELVLPMRSGAPEQRTHDYRRHGTTSLFAALNTATGEVIGRSFRKHRSVEFKRFLALIDKGRAARPRHPLGAGQLRHAQDGDDPRLAGAPSPVSPARHAHERVVAQPSRASRCISLALCRGSTARCGPPKPGARGSVSLSSSVATSVHLFHALEGLNTSAKIQWINRPASGYRNRERFRNAIYFHLGGLNIYPDALTHTNS